MMTMLPCPPPDQDVPPRPKCASLDLLSDGVKLWSQELAGRSNMFGVKVYRKQLCYRYTSSIDGCHFVRGWMRKDEYLRCKHRERKAGNSTLCTEMARTIKETLHNIYEDSEKLPKLTSVGEVLDFGTILTAFTYLNLKHTSINLISIRLTLLHEY